MNIRAPQDRTTAANSSPRTNASVRVRTELLDRLDAEAARRLVSRNYLIEAAIERLLAEVTPQALDYVAAEVS